MSNLSFVKYQGAGNDFILIDDRVPHFDPASVTQLCNRKFGIGADGVILLQHDLAADYRMRIFNNDGGEAEGCGNGLRCLMQFFLHLQLPRKTYRIATADRIVAASFIGDKVSIQMGPPLNVKQLYIEEVELHSLNTGVPHLVIFVPDVHQIDLLKTGSAYRHHPLFQPRGANVNFATIHNDSIHVRTYERGLEAETLACGTGAAAVGYIASQLHNIPNPIQIHYAGGDIEISIEPDGITQTGQAFKIFEGSISFF